MGTTALVMSEVFPAEAPILVAMEKEASESRIWAGIHVRSDIEAGRAVARGVSAAIIQWATEDGASR